MACPKVIRELDLGQGSVPCTSEQGGAFRLMVEFRVWVWGADCWVVWQTAEFGSRLGLWVGESALGAGRREQEEKPAGIAAPPLSSLVLSQGHPQMSVSYSL